MTRSRTRNCLRPRNSFCSRFRRWNAAGMVRGEIITMPPPGGLHGVSCLKVGRRLGNFVEDQDCGTVTSNDTGFITERSPDSVRGPDIAYWSRERLPTVPVGYIEVAPDYWLKFFRQQYLKAIRAKLKEYFAKGVRIVWVIAPEDRTLTVYRTLDEGRLLHEPATVTGEDVLPGFTCRVKRFVALNVVVKSSLTCAPGRRTPWTHESWRSDRDKGRQVVKPRPRSSGPCSPSATAIPRDALCARPAECAASPAPWPCGGVLQRNLTALAWKR